MNFVCRSFLIGCLVVGLSAVRPSLADDTHKPSVATPDSSITVIPEDVQLLKASLTGSSRREFGPEDFPLLPDEALQKLKGWDYVFFRVIQEGIHPEFAYRIFTDARMPALDTVHFSLTPKESKVRYRAHLQPARRKNAIQFYRENQTSFQEASERFAVAESTILAVLQVETNCGKFTGKSRIFYPLARLASAGSDAVIQKNFETKRKKDRKVTLERVAKRGKHLESTFLPHAIATLLYAASIDADPLELRGSAAGAIGLPQFLPGNFFYFGQDGNGDGHVDLFAAPDAIYSLANYLKEHGWENNSSLEAKRKVIWEYNHSQPYVDTVMELARLLERDIRKLTDSPTPAKVKVAVSGRAMVHRPTTD